MPSLTVITPNLPDETYPLEDTLIIGRHANNQIQLQEERASRIHCRVRLERGAAIVEDLESANGVYVNGLKTKIQALKHNDRIVIGATTLVYNEHDSEVDEFAVRAGDTMVLDIAGVDKEVRALENRAASAAKPARRRAPRTRSQASSPWALFLLVLCLGGVGYAYHLTTKERQVARVAEEPRKPDLIQSKAETATPDFNAQSTALPERGPEQPEKSALLEARLDERFQKALIQRDHALATGNVLGARAVLQTFIKALPKNLAKSYLAIKAARELDETSKVANATLQLTLDQALQAQDAKRFQVVFQRCTNLISNDPNGKYGQQAREMLEHIDERTQPVALAATAKAQEALKLGRLDQARAALEGAMGELSGTHWAGDIATLHLRIIVVEGFLAELETARAKKAAAKEKVPLVIASKQINGHLLGLKGLNAQIETDAVCTTFHLRLTNPDDFQKTIEALGASDRNAELSALWTLLDRPDAANKYSELAQQAPVDAKPAPALSAALTDSANTKRYDFSGWRQQTDWEALSGNWLTQDDKYVLETSDGGETVLKQEKIGGGIPLARARLGFDFEIRKPSNGWLFGCEFGSGSQALVLLFTDCEVSMQDKAGNLKNAPIQWHDSAARVEALFDGDRVSLKIDGQDCGQLLIPELSKQRGTLSFQARQCACALDNIVLGTR